MVRSMHQRLVYCHGVKRATNRGAKWLSQWATVIGLVALGVLGSAASLYAHGGGIPQLIGEVAGPYRIFAWTQPEPLRVGEFHLSIGVIKGEIGDTASTDSADGALDEAVTDATVLIHLLPVAQDVAGLTVPALLQEQLGRYYYEADATLPTPGEWRFTIDVSGPLGEGEAEFVSLVAAAREINWLLIGGAAFLLLCLLGLMGLWNRIQAKEIISDSHKTI